MQTKSLIIDTFSTNSAILIIFVHILLICFLAKPKIYIISPIPKYLMYHLLITLQNDNMYFKEGDGQKGDIDLQDVNGLTYDVKNDYVN